MMKKLFALLIISALIFSLAACGNSGSDSKNENDSAPAETVQATEAEPTEAQPAVADISSWKWVKGELDCYGYDECYLSYEVPDMFKTGTEDSSGMQYRGYYYNPSDPDATANDSPYGIYIYFNQGAFGATRETMEADIEGGFTERELGGRTVLFGEIGYEENAGTYAFSYYTSYSDDEYARIWFMVCDPEEDGVFRKTFEQSMSFTKE